MKNTVTPKALSQFCDELLDIDEFKDYCPNGLQVDADTPIHKIITGVTACQALIDHAVKVGADCILVHHGYFWKGESQPLVDMKGKRIRTLLQNNISLIAYHLPLDAHPTLGNNAKLAERLDLKITGALHPNEKHPIGNIATCTPITAHDLATKIEKELGRKPLHIGGNDDKLTKIGLCTGAAQDMIEQAALMGCDAFISGEISERTTHIAREMGIHYFAAGHHATERDGIHALGDLLADKFGIEVQFVDIYNPA
ncbi:Nif3-like dinuclear metal center hexameric protein [Moraxella nasovis]|uniref:Nif3-like dinuclear metal center hexameric protein n=1 Tax=Moraxella nasovis TaxID=2904121 RepID=UPI001F623339|nr:Nif3-like dinuclear metal center hexameric protein [Moraxella nasovis]UNU73223.1 Nif3-like dinuclear metal center hexameric protein [Moraxella nasovis]